MHKLNAEETAARMQALPQWTLNTAGGAISRQFVLADFVQAYAFMTQIAIGAERSNHHPEWSNVYNRVSITWTTHDVQGLSENDIVMAKLCDQAFAAYSGHATGVQ
jgi:4a-hydroxytetrahydrobiopterin dehydratase